MQYLENVHWFHLQKIFVLVIVWLWGQFGINSPRFILTFFEIARTKWGRFQKTSKWTEGLFSQNCQRKSYYSGLIVWQISTKYKSSSLPHSANLNAPSPFCFFSLATKKKQKRSNFFWSNKKNKNIRKDLEKIRIHAKALFTSQ